MIDFESLVKQLRLTNGRFICDFCPQGEFARVIWHSMPDLYQSFISIDSRAFSLCPQWDGIFSHVSDVLPCCHNYRVCAIDGSQIYPDRHEGVTCALINVGGIDLIYDGDNSRAMRFSTPFICEESTHDPASFGSLEHNIDVLRHTYELEAGCVWVRDQNKLNTSDKLTKVLFFDGSILFWHLMNTQKEGSPSVFDKSLKLLDFFHEQNMPVVWYVSMSHARDLVKLLEFWWRLQEKNMATHGTPFDDLVDADVVKQVLKPGQRTNFFRAQNVLVATYSVHQKPVFFYLHTGAEIARVEIPAWLAADEKVCTKICEIVMDQCQKGGGYPVCLAQAHAHVVITAADRSLFYHAIDQYARTIGARRIISRKNFLKKRLSV